MTIAQTAPDLIVSRAAEGDGPAVVGVLSAAFQTDVLFRWMFPDAARRAELNPALFQVLVDSHLPLGGIYSAQAAVDAAPVAAAVWVPEGMVSDADGEAEVVSAFMHAAAENAGRLGTVLTMMADVHPPEPHAYLFVIGTRPERHSQGLGSALIRHVTERLDRQGTAAYLEATCEGNRRLYARHGFADVGVIQLPDGPPLFRMWREPRCTRRPRPGSDSLR
jgi:ribosomal protein S18 acetylase RimI-like enzyme